MKKISLNTNKEAKIMRNKLLYSIIAFSTLIILVFILSRPMFGVPAIGKILNPFTGGVQNGTDERLEHSILLKNLKSLTDSVEIYFDEHQVPHIYASNTKDLYFAQGYVTAYLRLWQMDLTSYSAEGRLSEIFGSSFLEYDRIKRRTGMLAGAKKTLKMIEQDSETSVILTSYTNGVNAYIKELGYKNLPFEYKLLDYKPENWSNLKSILIMKYMSNMLTGYEQDANMTQMMMALGENRFNILFPNFNANVPPVTNVPIDKENQFLEYVKKPDYLTNIFLSSDTTPNEYNPHFGSNNWVVSGTKTISGFPILCNDPHLKLTFPNIWLQMQLTSHNMNVYGVSIPGAPTIIIGFNENIAWGVTNGATDVKDWYKLKISKDGRHYEYDGHLLEFEKNIEEIKIKGKPSLYDTIRSSIHGPIVYDRNFQKSPELINHALRWELQNSSNEFLSFYKVNKAKDFSEYKNAIKHYCSPIQNFVFAGSDNTISITHQGKIPIRSNGHGKFILDGTNSEYVTTKYIPLDSLPEETNPEKGYLFSANQQPTNKSYPYFYSGSYSKSRAIQIDKLLKDRDIFDLESMKKIQLDNTNSFATEALPVLIAKISGNSLSHEERRILKDFGKWNGAYNFIDVHAKLFELWMSKIRDLTWDKLKKFSFYKITPDDYVILNLIQQNPDSDWFDNIKTPEKEHAGHIITQAFRDALTEFKSLKEQKGVRWGDLNIVNIMHLTNIKAFSKMGIHSSGHPYAINAISKSWGPSWRMIVELGETPKGYGIYPGGQSGNIGSKYYDNFVKDWSEGRYYELLFFKNKLEAKNKSYIKWTLRK
ncbi:penicillin acylase family protein [Sphingobacterium sp. DR205]|uniref:penicillin acylase family protein n=1 Tax=Sphingobacterium sp. DR205 TaxID=2713573 RepID=UPI0013E4F614|nr:penicillin acylase family protein [Sphingobacterium sp. DR205]QIH33429.1 penicillin acylase family protein [Sphingobacterium sp. DR205]